MPISIWCILIAAILPIAAVFPAKLDKSYDNNKPRDPDYWRSGFRARASAAAANSFEALPFFAAAVIIGLWQGGSVEWINKLAVLFIGLRIIYILCYYTDRATPRSISWLAALLSAVAIFTSPIWSV
ncbi:MAPEG family protein [Roseibium algae]|uniref:MAPEG family protein n=1 Tax=Roseibium algae TaxID=3123038 RepID=A0ABU8TLY4_9HYPH